MADKTKIEWTDATWNPITGCSLVSEGCRNCYAARLAATRLKNHASRQGLARLNAAGVAKFTGEVRFNEAALAEPLRWKRGRKIFVCAHGDLFHENVPDEWIDRVFAVMALCPQHTFQVLTKRPERMRDYLNDLQNETARDTAKRIVAVWPDMSILVPPNGIEIPLSNVWLGTSIEDQPTADVRIPALLDTPAAKRFISAEPLLEAVDLTAIPRVFDDISLPFDALQGRWHNLPDGQFPGFVSERINWVIVGGESGKGARPMHPDWVRSLRDQCAAAGTAFFFKQWGEWTFVMCAGDPGYDLGPLPGTMPVRVLASCLLTPDCKLHEPYQGRGAYPDDCRDMVRIGKTLAGALLDGVEHREFPECS